ncbi:imelysin family protein [Oceanibaculum nanhaiense]|uniref:imelysin family protein n=1 Tax=Oceanibaculum nanhaiense TaxID=1909734 RepID=UPI00396EA287
MRFRFLAFLAALLAVSPVALAADPASYRQINSDLVTHHVIPRYAALKTALAGFDQTAGAYCAAPSDAGFAALQTAYGEASDAWQGVQHIRFGPVDLFMRQQRFAMWPDPRNTVGRQLAEMLKSGERDRISQKSFETGSVAVQGLPALERLLYDDAPPAGFACEAVTAISGNLAGMATDVLRAWREDYAQTVAKAGEAGTHYQSASEATLDLFKSLHAAVELVADHKLARPLGASARDSRPQLGEAWRSGRSMENIRVNLRAAEALYLGEGGGQGFGHFVRDVAGDKKLDDLFRRAFKQTIATADSVSLPLKEAVKDKDQRVKLVQLAKEAAALKQLLATRLTGALDIPLGFNALDGD